MAAPYLDLEFKLEAALASVIESNVSLANRGNAPVVTGFYAGELTLPVVVVSVPEGVGSDRVFANCACKAVIEVHTSADDSGALAAHRSRTAYVRDYIADDGLGAALSAAATDFHVIGIETGIRIRSRVEGRTFVSDIEITIYCAAIDLS